MKVKPLISVALVSSVLLGSVGSIFSVSAQGSAPPLAPSRLQRSPTSATSSSFNGSVLNGSVINNSTVGGASRLLRPATPPIVGSSAPIVAPGPSNSGSLFSADEQAAFSQVRQLSPLQQASPAIVAPSSYSSSANIQNSNSSIGSGSSNQSKFDIGQALRLGAQVVNAINASS
ncbi:hypothetical protein KBI23_10010, partial [bacterium]|nr:hypothetical protein [bacterium]